MTAAAARGAASVTSRSPARGEAKASAALGTTTPLARTSNSGSDFSSRPSGSFSGEPRCREAPALAVAGLQILECQVLGEGDPAAGLGVERAGVGVVGAVQRELEGALVAQLGREVGADQRVVGVVARCGQDVADPAHVQLLVDVAGQDFALVGRDAGPLGRAQRPGIGVGEHGCTSAFCSVRARSRLQLEAPTIRRLPSPAPPKPRRRASQGRLKPCSTTVASTIAKTSGTSSSAPG